MSERESKLETVRGLKRCDPFVPFEIVMSSGDRHRIEDPDALAIGDSRLFYYLPGTDRLVRMIMNEIAAVEPGDA